MKIKEIFSRDIDREIKSVILAQDESTIVEEIEEFVLTNDTAKQLTEFLEEYVDGSDQQAIGAWFSGFFGSGKSHLLKLVAHLLGEVAGSTVSPEQVLKAFELKAGATSQGAFLQGLIRKVRTKKAKVLLFNIASNFKGGGEEESAAALRVFLQVWNESLGLSKVLAVANFEKSLIEAGIYEEFKVAFEEDCKKTWLEARHSAQTRPASVGHAYRKATGTSPDDNAILRLISNDSYPSPKEFADEIGSWLDSSAEFDRVIFMVDEVGQFIGTDSQIMLNLQSVVESFFSLDKRVWVGVTSQEDLDNILEKFKQSGNDFQKISQRFKLRFQLTSTSVREVIQKRLLDKQDGAKTQLVTLYKESENKLATALTFRDGAKNSEPYKDEIDFVQTYPLIGWHLDILTEAMREISDRKGFTGAMVDVGARSTLGIFQTVIQSIGDEELGTLVTMDKMYGGIADLLKIPYKQSVELVDTHANSELKSRLIRVLLMVKHVGYFKPTPDNLAALILESVTASKSELVAAVEVALKSLTEDLFVERRGNEYFYLTSIEKDIEKEISKVSIDPNDVDSRVHELLQNAYPKSFFKHDATGRDFKFNIFLDDFSKGNVNNELSIRYVRANNSEQIQLAQSSGLAELRVLLAVDGGFEGDLIHLMRTEKFLTQHSGSADQAEQSIITAKYQNVILIKKELIAQIESHLSKAALLTNGQKLDIPESLDISKRFASAWQAVVRQIYVQLELATGHRFTSEEIKLVLTSGQGEFKIGTSPAADEVSNKIRTLSLHNQPVSLKQMCEVFESKPYGWELNSVLFFVASLAASGEVVLRRDGKILTTAEVARDLLNTSVANNVLLSQAPKIDQAVINRVKGVLMQDFGLASPSADSIMLGREVRSSLETLLEEIREFRKSDAPFSRRLDILAEQAASLLTRSDENLISSSADELQALGEIKALSFNPVKMFYKNSGQRLIYDQARALNVNSRADLQHFAGHDGIRLSELLEDEDLIVSNRIPELKQYMDSVSQKLASATKLITDKLALSLEAFVGEIHRDPIYTGATEKSKAEFDLEANSLEASIRKVSAPSAAQAASARFEAEDKKRLSELLVAEGGNGEKPIPSVPLSSLTSRAVSAPVLESETQIDAYLSSLRSVLIEAAKTMRIIR